MGFARIFNQVIQLLVTIILSRLLMPSEYGLVGMSMVVIGFGNIFVELGLGGAVIHNQESSKRDNSNIFWFNVLAGFILSAIIFLTAPYVARFYSNEELIPVIRVLSIAFIINSFSIVPRSLLLKKFKFQTTSLIEIMATLISGIFGIILALNNFGVWSLVYSYIVLKIIQSLTIILLSKFTPIFVFNYGEVKGMINYGLNVTGFNFINYWSRQSDTLLIGKFLSASSLGLYNRAYGLMLLPITQVTHVLSQVIFPAFASIQNDSVRIKNAYLKLQSVVSFICFPIMMGLAALASELTMVLFGEQWAGMVLTLRILCFVSLIQSLANSTGWLYTATGNTKKYLHIGIVNTLVTVTFIFLGVLWGSIEKVAICYLIANVFMFIPLVNWAGKNIEMSILDVFKKIYSPLFLSVLMGVIIFLTVYYLKEYYNDITRLFIGAVIGAIFYLGFAFVFKMNAFIQVKEVLLYSKK